MSSSTSVPTRHLFEATLFTTQTYDVVPHPGGARQSVCFFTCGRVEGERLAANLISGGGDWALFRTGDSFDIDVRAILQTEDGSIIEWRYRGVWAARPGTLARVFADGGMSAYRPDDHYVRVSSRFRAEAPSLCWLNDVLAIGYGRLMDGNAVSYSFHELL